VQVEHEHSSTLQEGNAGSQQLVPETVSRPGPVFLQARMKTPATDGGCRQLQGKAGARARARRALQSIRHAAMETREGGSLSRLTGGHGRWTGRRWMGCAGSISCLVLGGGEGEL
jgi:hypothetical protein